MKKKIAVSVAFAVLLVVTLTLPLWNEGADTQKALSKGKNENPPLETPGLENLTGQESNGVKKYELTAERVTQKFTDQYSAKAWGFNGSTPGPTLVAQEGDEIEITVTNNLPESTSVHWHGLEVPNRMDGVPEVQESPKIEPGKSFTYKFTVENPGTYMYHSHTKVFKQEPMGLAGSFVVQPKEPKEEVDRDIVMMLQEWNLEGAGSHSMSMESGNNAADETDEEEPSGVYEVNPMSMDPNMFTINGKSYPSTEKIKVNKGEKVRIRYTNASANSHPMHMHGDDFKVVGTDGNPIKKSAQLEKNVINVAPGETWDIEFTAENQGTWPIHCHKPHHTMNADGGMGGMFTAIEIVE